MKNNQLKYDTTVERELDYTDEVNRTYHSTGIKKSFNRRIYKNQTELINKKRKNALNKEQLKELLACYDINRYIFIFGLDIEISNSDLSRLIYLATFTNYNEGMLVHDNGAPVKEKDLQSILMASKVTTNRFKKNMSSLGIMTFTNNKIFISNEFVFKGIRPSERKQFSRMFNNSIRDLYLNSKSSSLAFIYKILPYIGFWHNVLCKNPNAKVDSPIEQLDWNDLCNILDIKNPSELKKKIKEYTFSNDEPILKTGTIGNKKPIYVNPTLVFKNNNSELFQMAYSIFSIGDRVHTSEYLPAL